jgi:hypothetical protein
MWPPLRAITWSPCDVYLQLVFYADGIIVVYKFNVEFNPYPANVENMVSF